MTDASRKADVPTVALSSVPRADASAVEVLACGATVALTVPGIILFASCLGFGALARDAGLSLANSSLMMATFFALPAQVALLDQLARGASVVAGAIAVTLTGIRLLPMVVTIMPLLRGGEQGRTGPRTFIAIHGVAITAWMEGFRRLPALPEAQRLTYFVGMTLGLVAISVAGAVMGHVAAATLPTVLAATLLFLTPIYFMISLLATAGVAADRLAIGIGGVLGPVFYLLAPGFDLLMCGLVGGTAAHLAARHWRRRLDSWHADWDGRGGLGP